MVHDRTCMLNKDSPRVQIVDNGRVSLRSVLAPAVREATDLRIAAAFVSQSGLNMLGDAIDACIANGASVEFLVGLDASGTEPRAVWALFDLSQRHANFNLYCYTSTKPATIYHPKVYLVRRGDDIIASVGSSNLTAGGLARNTEINVLLRGTILSEGISDLYASYGLLKFHPDRVIPDQEFLSLYEELSIRDSRDGRRMRQDDLRRRLMDKAASLRRPVFGRRDLVGWLELVYDALPEGEFTNSQVYEKAELFARHYPENSNVRAKIRQQLQMLRELNLIEHLATGRWRRP